MKLQPLSPAELLAIADSLALETGAWDKATHQPKNNEALNRALLPSKLAGNLARRSAGVFCAILKNKPFPKQNRRLAVAAIFALAAKNNIWLRLTPAELLWLIKLPEGKPAQWEAAQAAIEGLLASRLSPLRR
jgi:hypothetical protein